MSFSVRILDEWILHSGCTHIMCLNKEMFSHFKDIDGGVVYLGNENTCKTYRMGSNHLKIFDGAIRKLGEVRFVDGLKWNLISLGVL